jgi:hypothetical protein
MTMKKLLQLGLIGAMTAAVGCAGSGAPETEDALVIQSSPEVEQLGVSYYGVRVDDQRIDVELRGANDRSVGFLVVETRNQSRRATFSTGGRVLEAELLASNMIISIDGVERASFAFDFDGITRMVASQDDLTDIQADLDALVTIVADPSLKAGIDQLRATEEAAPATEYMFGLDDCPGWVVVGGCTAAPPVCAYCLIAWL